MRIKDFANVKVGTIASRYLVSPKSDSSFPFKQIQVQHLEYFLGETNIITEPELEYFNADKVFPFLSEVGQVLIESTN